MYTECALGNANVSSSALAAGACVPSTNNDENCVHYNLTEWNLPYNLAVTFRRTLFDTNQLQVLNLRKDFSVYISTHVQLDSLGISSLYL